MASVITTQNDVPSSNRQPPCFFTLPPEVRLMIYDWIEPDEIVLPRNGPLFQKLDGLARASKHARSDVLLHRLRRVTWCGRLTSKTWRMFKTALIPHIRNLVIEVKCGPQQTAFLPCDFPTWSALDMGCLGEARDVLTWMYWRSKPSLRARCAWRAKKLTIVAIFEETERIVRAMNFADDNVEAPNAPTSGNNTIRDWNEEGGVRKLKSCGVDVELKRKRAERLRDMNYI